MAAWQALGAGSDKIVIDRARVARVGDGLVSAWSRVDTPTTIEDAEGRYNRIEALNRYDCALRRFATLKRLYLLDDMLVRAESVLTPREMAATGVEAAIVAEVCRQAAPTKADAGIVTAPADQGVPSLAGAEPHFQLVANTAPATATPAPAPSVRRFLILPRIDPSQIEHPTDETPEEAKKAEKSAAKKAATTTSKSEAGKTTDVLSGMDRRSRELALATSGPRLASRAKRAAAAPAPQLGWSYAGEGAPSRWSKLSDDYGLCEQGQRQSPIDIRDGIGVDMEPIGFDYRTAPFRILDTGRTIQVGANEGGSIKVMGRTYRLTQIHFHHPAEERIDGRSFEMSMHLEHRDEAGRLAVVAVLMERGEEHPVIQTFWNHLPLETNNELASTTPVNLSQLLPEARDYYAYMGSLTTPPCTEGVLWLVMKQPLRISAEQLAIFARLYPNNARPLQAVKGRLIKGSP